MRASNLSPRGGRALLAAVLLAAGAGCGEPSPKGPNIVLIVIDTLRSDHLPCYGYERDTAPFITSLAGRGVVFERNVSSSSWTAPATASLLTSLHPIQHGVLSGYLAARARVKEQGALKLGVIPEAAETLAEVLQQAGYRTYGVSDNLNVTRQQGFAQGFDRFWSFNDEGAEVVNGTLAKWAETIRAEAPYFLYVHYMDPHRPYQRHAPWYQAQPDVVADEIAAYDSEIRFTDEALKRAYQALGWDRGTLLVITADHGEEFQDHGDWNHGRTLYDELIRVPLIVVPAAGEFAPRRVGEPTCLLDVKPTLQDYAGLPPVPFDQGRSLLPALAGQAALPADRAFYGDLRSAPWYGSRTLKSVTKAGHKYVWTLPETDELYDLAADPGELRNLAADLPDEAARMREMIQQLETGLACYRPEETEIEIDEDRVEKLKSLGYAN